MSTLTLTNSPAPTRDADELFLDLLCSDADLVRAEFDAIIAAEWPSPAPPEPGDAEIADPSPDQVSQRRPVRDLALADLPRHPGIDRWVRERSPPPARRTLSAAERAVLLVGPGRIAAGTYDVVRYACVRFVRPTGR